MANDFSGTYYPYCPRCGRPGTPTSFGFITATNDSPVTEEQNQQRTEHIREVLNRLCDECRSREESFKAALKDYLPQIVAAVKAAL